MRVFEGRILYVDCSEEPYSLFIRRGVNFRGAGLTREEQAVLALVKPLWYSEVYSTRERDMLCCVSEPLLDATISTGSSKLYRSLCVVL